MDLPVGELERGVGVQIAGARTGTAGRSRGGRCRCFRLFKPTDLQHNTGIKTSYIRSSEVVFAGFCLLIDRFYVKAGKTAHPPKVGMGGVLVGGAVPYSAGASSSTRGGVTPSSFGEAASADAAEP